MAINHGLNEVIKLKKRDPPSAEQRALFLIFTSQK